MLFVFSVPAQVQYRGPNAWVQVGFGTGLANITCDGCDRGWSSAGRSLFASLGGMVTPRFGFGIGLDRWWRSSADTDAITTRTVLLIRYRPEVHSGAFVEAGAGLSQADLRVSGTSQGKRSRFGLVSRVGYDVPVLRMAGGDICVTTAGELPIRRDRAAHPTQQHFLPDRGTTPNTFGGTSSRHSHV